MSKRWNVLNKSKVKSEKLKVNDILAILLENRGFKTQKDIDAFLHPHLEVVTPKTVGIDAKQLSKALKRIQKAMDKKEQIVIFGDYDVDGITGCAILWETLHDLKANVMPYIPHRKEEGYGLSIKGIENVMEKMPETKLIITVDNGIVANEAVAFANEKGIDVIVTDHHTVGDKLPDAHAIVHTTNLCGAGVAYVLAKEWRMKNGEWRDNDDVHLELAALGTVADLVPLIGPNRAIVFAGLKKLQTTTRPGLIALYQQTGIKHDAIGVYDIGYIIGPRLNAAGRILSAMDSLRLLCTPNLRRASELAVKLESTNKARQQLLKEAAQHAIANVTDKKSSAINILMVGHASYEEGVIGLVAGKLVEAFYRPSIVMAIGETQSKGSARSISGFNIIEFLRTQGNHFVNVGGHPMAAGFTIETAKIDMVRQLLEETAMELLTEELVTRMIKIDCELSLDLLNEELYQQIQQLAPFGMANAEPVFASRGVTIENIRVLGKERNHLKLTLSQNDSQMFEAIAFGMGALAAELKVGDKIAIAYVLDENTWNGLTKLQLKVKDIKILE
ncbi:MAG: single-stranded-DNA-specific exonuclease RecJ [Candidatus Levyibacteriota bacterium]